MKKIFLFVSIFILTGYLFGQNNNPIKAGWGNLDYSVPESPAFNLLGNNPDNIIKPTSVRSIVLNIGNYYLKNGATIPKNLAIEISPLLLNPVASLNDYQKNKFLYRMRLSVGTNLIDNGAFEIAEGLRFSIIDKTDLRCESEFLDKLYQSCTNKSAVINKAIKAYVETEGAKYKNVIDAKEAYDEDINFKIEINELSKRYFTNEMVNPDSISSLRDKTKQKLWNATIWEVGIATMQYSPDSLANHLSFSKAGLWTTYGTHLTKKDQLLIGGKFSLVDSLSNLRSNVTIGTRYYYGKNDLRAFVQGEYRFEKNMNSVTASLGCIFNITNGIWGQFAMNFIFYNGNVIYKPSLNINFGTREKSTM